MAADAMPAASVIIPTHNRCTLLRRVLDVLSRQTEGTEPFEVVVVADGCVDDTGSMLAAYPAPFPLKVVERGGEGPAIARNAGAEQASGELLIFLDDDVEPGTGFVAAHLAAQNARPGSAGIGPYPPAPHASADAFRQQMRAWWLDHFGALAEPSHRFSFHDLLTGNLSLSKRLWNEIGGLDPVFARAREDLELGIRLMQRGIPFQFVPGAAALHYEHETATPEGALRRAVQEGRSDALIALKHRSLSMELKIQRLLRSRSRARRGRERLLRIGGLLDPLMAAGPVVLRLLNRAGSRNSHRFLLGALQGYWYRRGAMSALGDNWKELMRRPLPDRRAYAVTIDLKDGIAAAEAKLSELRPPSVRLTYGETELGILHSETTAEAWDGRHLRGVLSGRLAVPFLAAVTASEAVLTEGSHPHGWRTVGRREFQASAAENYFQWEYSRVA